MTERETMTSKLAALIRAVAYYRMSTDKQDASIPAQRKAVVAYALKHGYRIIREYIDEGISGDATEKRLGFQSMIGDSTRGEFEAVLCWDQDRFGRFDPIEGGFWIKPMRDAGVVLVTVAQGRIDWSDFAGRLTWMVQQEGKYAFLKDLSRNVSRGMLARAMEGKRNGGRPPYGYRTEGGLLVIGEDEQTANACEMFATYADTQATLSSLSVDLNRRGIPSPTGKHWSPQSVKSVLTNPTYCGRPTWNRVHRGKYHGITGGEVAAPAMRSTGRITTNERADWIPAECPAMIEESLWDRVQAKILAGSTGPKRPNSGYPLSGMVACGHCGYAMYGWTDTAGRGAERGPRRKYRCRGGTQKLADCGHFVIDEAPLVNAIWKTLEARVFEPANLKRIEQEIRRQLAAGQAALPGQAKQLQRRITGLDRQIDQGTSRLLKVPEALMPEVAQKIEQMKAQREAAQFELDALVEVSPSSQETDTKRAVANLWNLRELLVSGDMTLARQVFEATVSEARVWFRSYRKGKRMLNQPVRGVLTVGIENRPLLQARQALLQSRLSRRGARGELSDLGRFGLGRRVPTQLGSRRVL
jgi:site-specific DNA recombinase